MGQIGQMGRIGHDGQPPRPLATPPKTGGEFGELTGQGLRSSEFGHWITVRMLRVFLLSTNH
jgi:hypothetical protein